MDKYKCTVCGYIYDPEKGDPDNGYPPGTSFDALPEGWTCPECGAAKTEFVKISLRSARGIPPNVSEGEI